MNSGLAPAPKAAVQGAPMLAADKTHPGLRESPVFNTASTQRATNVNPAPVNVPVHAGK